MPLLQSQKRTGSPSVKAAAIPVSGGNVYATDWGSGGSGFGVKEILSSGHYATVNTVYSVVEPWGVALDKSSNLYVGGYGGTDSVFELSLASGYSVPTTLGSGFSYPANVAVDKHGDVFVADSGNSAIKEILAAGGFTTVKTLGSGFNHPLGVALDAIGDVFVADTSNGAVKEILAAGGYTTVSILNSGFSTPAGVAVDASGNVFVADPSQGGSGVKEILAAGGYTTVNTLGSGFLGAQGVAVDKKGDVYVADSTGGAVYQIVAVGGSVPTSPTINKIGGSGFSYPVGIVLQHPAIPVGSIR